MSAVVAQIYDASAADYERTRVPRFRPFVKKLFQLYDTRPRSRVLDAGTGTGLAATMVAPRAGREGYVLGVDLSEGMLALARQKAKSFGFTQCDFRLGDMAALDLPEGEFDLVIASFSLWAEPIRLFTEFRRLLRPDGGALLLQNWLRGQDPSERIYDQIFEKYRIANGSELLELVRGVANVRRKNWEHLLAPADYERMLRQVSFGTATASAETLPQHFENAAAYVEWRGLEATHRVELDALDSAGRTRFCQEATRAYQALEAADGLDVYWTAIQVLARTS